MEQTPSKDTPFGLEPNVAAGLAYLFSLVGGIVMLVGGGSNKFVRWASAQSIVMAVVYTVVFIILQVVVFQLFWVGAGLGFIGLLLMPLLSLTYLAAWLWTFISAFGGKEVRVPLVAPLTERLFSSML